jgi:hypothetical protein
MLCAAEPNVRKEHHSVLSAVLRYAYVYIYIKSKALRAENETTMAHTKCRITVRQMATSPSS